jgi:hypothetical protein
MQLAHLCAGATGMGLAVLFCCFGSQYSSFIIGRCFPFFKGDGIRWALGQTIAQAVAVILAGECRFAINQFDSAFVASYHTGTTAIATFLVNLDNFS